MQENNDNNIYPPFKKQNLTPPGLEKKLDPLPKYISNDYIGSHKLKNKTALITGGDSGIGRAIAVHYAREGASLIAITYLKSEKDDAEKTCKYIEAEGGKSLMIESDFSDAEFTQHITNSITSKTNHLDILINNAAFQNHLDDIDDLSFSQFQHTFEVNLFSSFKLVKAFLPLMNEGSCIINTTSILGYTGDNNLIDYSSTKGAIHSLTKSLAKDLSQRKIRVNSVAPGPVWTPLNPAERKEEEVRDFGKNTLFGRPAQPSEIAPAYVFLASNITASYITGETINIFGMVNGSN